MRGERIIVKTFLNDESFLLTTGLADVLVGRTVVWPLHSDNQLGRARTGPARIESSVLPWLVWRTVTRYWSMAGRKMVRVGVRES